MASKGRQPSPPSRISNIVKTLLPLVRSDSDSCNRTGAANIGDAGRTSASRKDVDLVPETAVRPSSENADYHTGRGGAGNEHVSKPHATTVPDGARSPKGLADKLKHMMFGGGKK